MLRIYKFEESTSSFSALTSADFTNPASFNVTPGGTALVKKFYIRNDDATKYYDGVILRPVTSTDAVISGTAVQVKLLSGDVMPTDTRWAAVGSNGPDSGDDATDPADCAVLQSPIEGDTLDTRLPEFGSAGTPDTKYYPFWIRVESARSAPLGVLSLGLQVTYTEHAV